MPELIHNEAAHEFEFRLEDDVAFIEYFTEDRKIYLTHTEVPESKRGQGIGTALVGQTLQYLKKNHWTVVPQCAFVAAYIDAHTQWHSILPEGYQM